MAKMTKRVTCVENTTAHVIVFKAVKQKPLRLFPGFNKLKTGTDLNAYLKGNNAAKGCFDDKLLKVVDSETLTEDQARLAQNASDKNDTMNKAYKVIAANKVALAAKDDALMEQAQAMDDMKATMDDMKSTMSSQAEQIDTLLKKLDEVAADKMAADKPVDEEIAK